MKPKETDLKWHVLYTRPKFEKKICEEIGYLRFENYLPVRTVVRRWSDRVKKIEEPLFAGYVFVKKGSRQGADLLQIPGVIRFVATGGRPDVITDNEIDKIRLIESEGRDVQKEDYFSAGDPVMIKQGVFAGITGVLVRNVNQQPRFMIRLPLLKQAISVEVSAEDLMSIN
jgi:transcription antitermination factor NusG